MLETATVKNRHSKPKIDFQRAFELRYLNGLNYKEVGKILGCSASAIHQKLQPLKDIVENSKLYNLYHTNANQILKLTEATLLEDLLNPAKIKKASLNNVAYAYSKVREARKGQVIGNTTLTIEVVFQEAEDAAKKLRKSHHDIVIGPAPEAVPRLTGGAPETLLTLEDVE